MTHIPEVETVPAKPRFWQGASLVWLVPLLALLVALGIAWQSYSDRGRIVDVAFVDGSGIAVNTTELRYRDVAVGIVEEVTLSDGLETVIARIRLTKEIDPYVDNDAQFWVVRPEVTAQGVTGLDTVLNGVFIEGSWDGVPGDQSNAFSGLPQAPLFRPDRPGLQLALRSTSKGQLVDNSPILFRGVEVGRVGTASIDPRGNFAIAEAIIFEPYTRLINSSSRFWDASGFSLSVGAAGASIDFSSLASLVGGGITFDTFVSGGDAVSDGDLFQVYEDENGARSSIFDQSESEELLVSTVFDDNIAGLQIGSAVELGGLRIGSVSSVSGIIDPGLFGDSRVRLNAILSIQPGRMGLPDTATPDDALAFFRESAESGHRARLASASLLTGGLKIEFVEVEDAPAAAVLLSDDGMAVLPTTQSEISDAAATMEGLLTRVNNLPVEDLLVSAIGFLDNANAFVADQDLRETPKELRLLLADARRIVASDDIQAVAPNLNRVVIQVETLLKELETVKAVEKLTGAIDAAATAAKSIDTSIAGVPALIENLNSVAAKAADLPLEELTEQAASLVATGTKLLESEGAQKLPATLNSALGEVDATLRELREGGAVDNVNETLASTRKAADAVATSAVSLPDLVDRVTRVLNQASETIKGYDRGEVISRDAQAALRDIEKAAEAITSLARTLERNPNALIRGRN